MFAKLVRGAVADAQSIVHGEDDEAAAGEVLVDGVVGRVLPAVVIAEQHLPRAATVDIDDRGPTRAAVGRAEHLSVDLRAVARRKRHGLRDEQLLGRKILRDVIRGDQLRCAAGHRNDGRNRRSPGIRRNERERLPVARHDRIPLDPQSRRQRDWPGPWPRTSSL